LGTDQIRAFESINYFSVLHTNKRNYEKIISFTQIGQMIQWLWQTFMRKKFCWGLDSQQCECQWNVHIIIQLCLTVSENTPVTKHDWPPRPKDLSLFPLLSEWDESLTPLRHNVLRTFPFQEKNKNTKSSGETNALVI